MSSNLSSTMPPSITKRWPLSYWMPDKPGGLADFQSSSNLPSEADIVIIGSGFSGASVAYHLLHESKSSARVVMLEARQACSGASGRNGGHMQPSFFPGPPYGESQVKRGQFERQNYEALEELICKHRITSANTTFTEEGETKQSEGWLIYPTKVEFDEALARLSKLTDAGGDTRGLHVYFGNEARLRTGINNIVGAISHTASPINPYELVSWLLVQSLATGLYLYTNTPVESVVKTPVETLGRQDQPECYNVTTNKGVIKARKVIFATNAYSSHLLGNNTGLDARLRSPVYPVRGQVTAYRVPTSIPAVAAMLPNRRSNRLNLNWEQEYCVVLPSPGKETDHVDFVYGGARRYGAGLQIGLVDDNTVNQDVSSTLDDFFQFRLGIPLSSASEEEEATTLADSVFYNNNFKSAPSASAVNAATKKSEWTGIMGFTEDENPCVGSLNASESLLVIAGFGGHGMPRIFLSAQALVSRFLSGSAEWPEWFPEEYKN